MTFARMKRGRTVVLALLILKKTPRLAPCVRRINGISEAVIRYKPKGGSAFYESAILDIIPKNSVFSMTYQNFMPMEIAHRLKNYDRSIIREFSEEGYFASCSLSGTEVLEFLQQQQIIAANTQSAQAS